MDENNKKIASLNIKLDNLNNRIKNLCSDLNNFNLDLINFKDATGFKEVSNLKLIKSKIEELKDEIRNQPNRDDQIYIPRTKAKAAVLDGGGRNLFNVLDEIDKAFEDVMK